MYLIKTQNNCYIDVDTGETIYQVKEKTKNGEKVYVVYAKNTPISIEYQHRGAAVNYLKDFMAINYGIKEEKKEFKNEEKEQE